MTTKKQNQTRKKPARSILQMTATQARAFLLKPESYCGIDLPVYFTFARVLSSVTKELSGKALSSMSSKPRDHEGVNYSMLSNKDGRHAWRPLQLVHPALYVSLVQKLTEPVHWKVIRDRFREFQKSANLKCLSIPIEASTSQKDKAAQILNWWQGIEQGSIEFALDYNYAFHADITDCYSAIYTHSIAWAVHGKANAKAARNDKTLIGNIIDSHIQDMRHGQTNGIPQGSTLMDFISELVLGYADLELSSRLKDDGITEFRILRYRDDYRIFVQNPQIGESILKCLTEVLIDLGLKLNASKTTSSQLMVSNAIKPDKRAWLRGRQGDANLQRHLLVIHAHGHDFPNAGSLTVSLAHFHERLSATKRISNPLVLISIATDIAYHSPKAFPVCSAIISKLLSVLPNKAARKDAIQKIHAKLSQLPNTGHMEVWLQRISHSFVPKLGYKESLCRLVKGDSVALWNNDWITSAILKTAVDSTKIVNKAKLRSLKPIVRPKEIELFASERY
ncbi:MAG: RNA-directed DNA polymerase [bacterium]